MAKYHKEPTWYYDHSTRSLRMSWNGHKKSVKVPVVHVTIVNKKQESLATRYFQSDDAIKVTYRKVKKVAWAFVSAELTVFKNEVSALKS